MRHAKLIDFLFFILPLKAWKDSLLRRHVEGCPACSRRLASQEEARRVLIRSDKIRGLDSFWPEVEKKLASAPVKTAPFKPSLALQWRWAIASAGVILAALAVFWLGRGFKIQPPVPASPRVAEERFAIRYLKIEDKPARAYIFQPQGSEMIFIWAEKNI
jgi:anti-sigma factor RsiW